MEDIDELIRRISRLDVNDILLSVWKRADVQEFIIQLNTEGQPTSQLFEDGIDSLGNPITGLGGSNWLEGGSYSPFTVAKKREAGQRTDHPTLKSTGGFYRSFVVVPSSKGFKVTANFDVGEDNLLDVMANGVEVTGLTEKNTLILLDFIEPLFSKEFANRLL